jgi:nitrile hydratase
MNGVHDMGGMHGLGPVEREEHEPIFHQEWERRVMAMSVAAGFLGRWNLDMSRFARELMPAGEYLTTSYYEHWLWGLEFLLRRAGLLGADEVDGRLRAPRPGRPPAAPRSDVQPLRAEDTEARLRAGKGARRDDVVPARFRVGDRVRARNIHPLGHTRLPRYARGRQGTIDRDHGVWVFPDTSAAGQGENPQHVYSVRFAARELWGADASPRDAVYLDLWDEYMEPA